MDQPSTTVRRRAIRWAYANAFVWALGNGLVGTPLVTYLAMSLGAKGLTVGWILAAPNFVGLLRLFAPGLLQASGRRQPFVVAAYALSSVFLALLAILPLLIRPRTEELRVFILCSLVVLWSIYHLFEYLGTVAFWTWLGDLTPARLRGRFLGRREWYLLVGRCVGMALAGEVVAEYHSLFPEHPPWIPYTFPALVGAFLMLLASLLLLFMPALERLTPSTLATIPWRSLLAALTDRRNRRYLTYNVWFSFFNGITGVAQNEFVMRRLGFELRLRLLFESIMRIGQVTLATETGRWIDRFGNKRVMVVSQLLVAAALGFFLLANSGERWLLAGGAWIMWIAYVGLNVALPNVMLRVAPRDKASAYVAVNHALAGLFAGFSMLAGGWLVDALAIGHPSAPDSVPPLAAVGTWLASFGWSRFQALFLLGLVARALGVFWIQRIDDRPADELDHIAAARGEQPA